jgi:golgi-specific brefeldin A-resistance guanine nucleotide exchange factor 1
VLTSNRSLPQSSLSNLVDALLFELPEENASAVIVVKTERSPSGGPRPSSAKGDLTSPGYNPGMLYTLELATVLAIRDSETIEYVGENLAGSLQGIIRDARNVHPVIVSRVLYYLLNLLRLSYVSIIQKSILNPCSYFLGSTFYARPSHLACYF